MTAEQSEDAEIAARRWACDKKEMRRRRRETLPRDMRWLFPEIDTRSFDVAEHVDFVLARILEHGRTSDVRWAIGRYGMERIHRFFREVGHPDLSDRTLCFWRAMFGAGDEKWASPPAWRKSKIAPWIY